MMKELRRMSAPEGVEKKVSGFSKARLAVERTLGNARKGVAVALAAVALQACGDGKELQIVPVPGGRVEIYSQSLEVARRLCPQKAENTPGVVDVREIPDNSLTVDVPGGVRPATETSAMWVINRIDGASAPEDVTRVSVDTLINNEVRRTDNLVPVSAVLEKKNACEEELTRANVLETELGEEHWRTQQAKEDADACVKELNNMQFETSAIDENGEEHNLFVCETKDSKATVASSKPLEEVPVEAQ